MEKTFVQKTEILFQMVKNHVEDIKTYDVPEAKAIVEKFEKLYNQWNQEQDELSKHILAAKMVIELNYFLTLEIAPFFNKYVNNAKDDDFDF